MEVRWSQTAARDLEAICDHIAVDSLEAAARVARTIYDGCGMLGKFPQLGRASRIRDRRELVIAPFPYIVVYLIAGDAVHLLRIYHGAQDRPDRG